MAITKVSEGTFVVEIGTGSESKTLPGTPLEGDLVLVGLASDQSFSAANKVLTSGYSMVYDGGTQNPASQLQRKFMGSTPDTSVLIEQNDNRKIAVIVQIWRGVDATTPIDATPVTASGASGSPNPNDFTSVTNNALIFAAGFQDDDDAASYGGIDPPAGFGDFLIGDTGQSSTANGATVMFASKIRATAGTESIDTFDAGDDAWEAVSFALRPAVASATGTMAVTKALGKVVAASGTVAVTGTSASGYALGKSFAASGGVVITGAAVTVYDFGKDFAASGSVVDGATGTAAFTRALGKAFAASGVHVATGDMAFTYALGKAFAAAGGIHVTGTSVSAKAIGKSFAASGTVITAITGTMASAYALGKALAGEGTVRFSTRIDEIVPPGPNEVLFPNGKPSPRMLAWMRDVSRADRDRQAAIIRQRQDYETLVAKLRDDGTLPEGWVA